MLGWLKSKGENSRVYMCIKEVKWELEQSPIRRCAVILALSHIIRVEMLEDGGIDRNVIDRPLDYTRKDLMQFYEILESIRNQSNYQLQSLKKGFARLGGELPEFAATHAKNTSRALEVWMCTLGAGIVPDRRDDVREIWGRLTAARSELNAAIQDVRRQEKLTEELTGGPVSMFSGVSEAEWADYCKFTPAVFAKELRIE